MLLLRALSLACLIALPAIAQEKNPGARTGKQEPVRMDESGGVNEKGEESADGTGDAKGEEKPAAPAIRSPRGFAHFVTTSQPKRIPPGGSGNLVIIMVLEGDAVLTSPAPVTFDFLPEQGPFRLGQPVLRPASLAALAPGFQGREVYDNTATIDVPITVMQNQILGKHHVSIGLTFELHQGRTATSLGQFQDRVGQELEIGIPEAPVGGQAGGAVGAAVPANGQAAVAGAPVAAPAAGQGTGGPGAGTAVPGGAVVAPAGPTTAGAAAPGSSGDAGSDMPPVAQDDGMLWLAAAGGFVVLALIVLLASRKRG